MSTHSCSTTPLPPLRRRAVCFPRRPGRAALMVLVVVVVVAAVADESAVVVVAGCLQAVTALLVAWPARTRLILAPRR